MTDGVDNQRRCRTSMSITSCPTLAVWNPTERVGGLPFSVAASNRQAGIAASAGRWFAFSAMVIVCTLHVRWVAATPCSLMLPAELAFVSAGPVTKQVCERTASGASGDFFCRLLSISRTDVAKDTIPQFVLDLVYAHEHGLLDDTIGRSYQRVIDADVADGFITGEVERRVRRHKIAQVFAGPFSLPKLNDGDFLQGMDQNNRRVLFPMTWLNAHSLTLAGSGSGKTTKAIFHTLQIIPRTRGCWLLDVRKTEFQKLGSLLARIGVELIVLPVRQMRFNPLQVPVGVEASDWISRIADTLVMVLGAPPRASKLLESSLHRLFSKFHVFDGADEFPTLFDLFLAIREDKVANPQARMALLDSLDPLLASLGPEVLAYRRGWSTHDLAKLPINFVLCGVSEAAQNLVLNTLLLAEFTSRVARGVSNPRMDLFVSVDEGQRLVAQASGYHNALADLWPLVRGTGIGLDISVPTSHGLMPEALSFTATKYLGRCGSASDYETVGRSMGLTRAQLDWTFHNTRPGRFIVQVGEGAWRRPYVLDIPNLSFARPTDFGGESNPQKSRIDLPSLPAEGQQS